MSQFAFEDLNLTIFNSSDHPKIAHDLSDIAISNIASNPDLGGELVADKLKELRNLAWDDGVRDNTKRNERYQEIFNIDDAAKNKLLEAYAQMGHLSEIAALSAREHYLANLKEPSPGGPEALVKEWKTNGISAQKAAQNFSKPVFEVVMTMHPTNTNALESIQAQRNVAKAIQSGNLEALKDAVLNYQKTPLLHQQNGHDANMTVRDETKVVINTLKNTYEDLPKIYAEYDRALAKLPGYDPLALNLNIRFGTWGSSGDKDGNLNVTAETTLEAIALHTLEAARLYHHDLQTLATTPALNSWKDNFATLLNELGDEKSGLMGEIAALRRESDEMRKNNMLPYGKDINERFDHLSKKLSKLRSKFIGDGKENEFIDALTDAYKQSNTPESLSLLRRAKLFGFGLAKIEYRETAKEYARVVEAMVPDYEKMTPSQRLEKLGELLGDPTQIAVPQQKLESTEVEGAGLNYHGKDKAPIAYHTLKRLELARDFPDMIKDNVLAECGQLPKHITDHSPAVVAAQGAANLLEALLLQKIVQTPEKKLRLGIVPLFEEPDTMNAASDILRNVYKQPAYQDHLQALADERHNGKKTQQVQIAHSDNARRAGVPAARANIHDAHIKVRKLNDEMGIASQFFEGGSLSDAYRNGVRAISATVNAFNLHDFAKFTFQGGDLLNYFNHPASSVRLFSRNISHQAAKLYRDEQNNGHGLNGNGSLRAPDPELNDLAIEALKATLPDYQQQDFTKKGMAELLEALNYNQEVKDGGRGSRAGGRSAAPAKTEVDIENARTIGFSKAWQHNGIEPSWIGVQNLKAHLAKAFSKTTNALFGTYRDHKADMDNVIYIHRLYNKSPAFRDAMDKVAFAVARSDLDYVSSLPSVQNDKEALRYLEHLKKTYKEAATLAYAALTGKKLDESNSLPKFRAHTSPESEIQDKMLQALGHSSKDIKRKLNYRDALLYLKSIAPSDPYKIGNHEQAQLQAHMRGIMHNGLDTVMHGRYLLTDDPAYCEQRFPSKARAAA